MSTLSTKASLYDLLSMIIPGYLVLFLLHQSFFQQMAWHYDDVTFGVVTFAISYIVGILIHLVAKAVFSSLRNRECLVSKAKDYVNKKLLQTKDVRMIEENVSYYEAYYIASRYAWSSVPILEAQYSFLRSALIVELLYLVFGCKVFSCPCILSFIAVLGVITIFLMLYLLYKTHIRIWEDYAYITQAAHSS